MLVQTIPISRASFGLSDRALLRPRAPTFPSPTTRILRPILTIRRQCSPSWVAPEIAEATGGEIVRWGTPGSISTDTRTLTPGQWFFALSGANFDGHDFIRPELGDVGCVGVVGNRVCTRWGRGFVRVEGDTMRALERMGRYARDRFTGVVVAVTGSVGKTTTTAMTALALEGIGGVYRTPGNWNNGIGVALTLVGMPSVAKAAVLELGMSGKGEILELGRMCRPKVRVVLNVGYGHMGNLGSLEEVAEAKGELLREAKPGDICVLNADDPLVMSIPLPGGVKKVLFGRGEVCDVQLVSAESCDEGCTVRLTLRNRTCLNDSHSSTSGEFTAQMAELKINGPGLHLAMDACAATAVAVSLGVPLAQVRNSLSKFKPVSMRSELEIAENGIRIINDAYNANLTSMTAAISTLKSIVCKGKRVAILGDMHELGATAAYAHVSVLNLCATADIGLVALVGQNFIAAVEVSKLLGMTNVVCVLNADSLAAKIVGMLDFNDVVLVKGSRTMHMEKIVEAIKVIKLK